MKPTHKHNKGEKKQYNEYCRKIPCSWLIPAGLEEAASAFFSLSVAERMQVALLCRMLHTTKHTLSTSKLGFKVISTLAYP